MKALIIGDPHFQIKNIITIDLFIKVIYEKSLLLKPDFIVILGDILHDHEKINTLSMNKALIFIEKMRTIAHTYILVGNHDLISNTEFLSDSHWMNALKCWKNVTIIDTVQKHKIDKFTFTFCPYVYPGRFLEALETLEDSLKTTLIFAHQEFYGCSMLLGINSREGDVWSLDLPPVISGHIHTKQKFGNIYYPGIPFQHNFGDSSDNTISLLTFQSDKTYRTEEIDLKLPKKISIETDITEFLSNDFKIDIGVNDIRLILKGQFNEFQIAKKTKKFKDLNVFVKIIFSPSVLLNEPFVDTSFKNEKKNFKNILYDLILKTKNKNLYITYDLIVNKIETNSDDILFV